MTQDGGELEEFSRKGAKTQREVGFSMPLLGASAPLRKNLTYSVT